MEYIFQVLDEYIEGNVSRVPSVHTPVTGQMHSQNRVAELEKAHTHKYLCLKKKYDALVKKNAEYQDLLASRTARVHDLEDAINTIMIHADYFKNELASYRDDDTNMERNYIYI